MSGGEARANARRPLSSAFAGVLVDYVAHKRVDLGYAATMEEIRLAPSFDRFCREAFPGRDCLDRELAESWVGAAKTAHSMRQRASFMRGLARFVIWTGGEAYVLPEKMSPIRHGRPLPHLFTQSELDAFFAAADATPRSRRTPVRHLEVPVFFRLMYCTGLRPQEARLLPASCFDFDEGVIHVVDSKDRRDRDVPVAPDVVELCCAYSSMVEAVLPGREAFFPNHDGSGYWAWGSMYKSFHDCWRRAGVTEFSGPTPRPYDFRHAYATNVVRKWKAEGVDVHGNLRVLQECMGHADLSSTLYYIQLVSGGLGDPTLIDTWEPENRMRGEMLNA